MQMFPLMRTFAIIGILLVNVYSTRKYSVKVGNKTGNLGTRKYLVEVGNERSEEDEASEPALFIYNYFCQLDQIVI